MIISVLSKVKFVFHLSNDIANVKKETSSRRQPHFGKLFMENELVLEN